MDDTAEDQRAIQSVINQIVAYPLEDFDGRDENNRLGQAACDPGPEIRAAAAKQWVVPEKFFDQFADGAANLSPLPGEQALYAQFRLLLDAAAKDPKSRRF